ncbi:MAG TPA: beta-galactosidase [Planctomycetota bacterium]
MAKVSFDGVAVTIDGQRKLVLSGAVHYPRATPEMWPKIIRASKEAGLNTIETYVFWCLHEHQKGKFDFTGRLDLLRFLQTCQDEGMNVVLRIGPYVCAEINFGGLAPWLIHEPGMVSRTNNEPFKKHMEQWCQTLMARVGEYQATRGGPIVLVQLENEYNNVAKRYGEEGKKYAEWVVQLAPKIGVEVPLIMCEGSAEGAIETLNGFSVAERVPEFKKHNPSQPALWTENWPGWYDTFGVAHHLRDARELAYNVIRFFAAGGTGVNYYMWFGGTNFGREAMYMQTTSYDFDAPINEYGQLTEKGRHLGKLHTLLATNARLILSGAPQVEVLKEAQEKQTLPQLAIYKFIPAGTEAGATTRGGEGDRSALYMAVNSTSETQKLSVAGVSVTLLSASAAIVQEENGKARLAFSSHDGERPRGGVARWIPAKIELKFKELPEPLPDSLDESVRETVDLPAPASMLPYTRDLTDYGWYQTTLNSRSARTATLTLPMVRDFSMLFVNGQYVGRQPDRLDEDCPKHWKHEYTVKLAAGKNRVTVLVAAFGLIKGDWMLDAPMTEEKKGLIGEVLVDGKPAKLEWTLDVGLFGERRRLFDPLIGSAAKWEALKTSSRPLRWLKAEFGALDPKAAGYALDIGELYKGMIWLNGQCAGRYAQIPAAGPETSWQHGFVTLSGIGEPTQRYYHLPLEWLKERNTLVIFEETSAAPKGVKIVRVS